MVSLFVAFIKFIPASDVCQQFFTNVHYAQNLNAGYACLAPYSLALLAIKAMLL